jgi:hypothetical protein
MGAPPRGHHHVTTVAKEGGQQLLLFFSAANFVTYKTRTPVGVENLLCARFQLWNQAIAVAVLLFFYSPSLQTSYLLKNVGSLKEKSSSSLLLSCAIVFELSNRMQALIVAASQVCRVYNREFKESLIFLMSR